MVSVKSLVLEENSPLRTLENDDTFETVMRQTLLAVIISCLPFLSFGQLDVKDSIIPGVILKVSYGVQFPELDMKDRFGIVSGIGGELVYKTAKHWMFGIHGQYQFGFDVKESGETLAPLANSIGSITNVNGESALISVEMEGWTLGGEVGWLLPWGKVNANSGIILTVGGGFMQHRIKYNTEDNAVPQLEGDYVKNFDRMTNGPYARQFLGYHFQGNNRLTNFYGGAEFIQGFTTGRRSYDVPTGGPMTGNRLDVMFGIRIGWMLPFYERVPDKYYYY